MEQFRQLGEVAGSLKTLMVFREEIQTNRRQCTFLLDIVTSAHESIAEQMKRNLKFNEKQTKWKVIEQPLKELHRIFKEIEIFIRQSLEPKDRWVQAITFHENKNSVNFHVHNLLSCIPVVIEAIEMAGELTGLVDTMKYRTESQDPKVFQWRFGNTYLVSDDFVKRFDSVWEEDQLVLVNSIKNTKKTEKTKNDRRLSDVILTKLGDFESRPSDRKLFPSSTLLDSKDYNVKRRLGVGKEYKEIQWRREGFILRQFNGDPLELNGEISRDLTLSHPNVIQIFCGFFDELKNEAFIVMELANRDLSSYVKEVSGVKKRVPFSIPVAVDLMVQIARGMEYLHSNGIRHGELNPSNVLVKSRTVSTDGYLHAKVSGFGLSSSLSVTPTTLSNQNESNSNSNPFIWYAPEVLEEQERSGNVNLTKLTKLTEKSDVYSFGMICFQLLTGKVPFEDGHLQGDKTGRNIRAGERPLFPSNSLKFLTNLTRRCWHADPDQRPSFSSICRILRYVKRYLLLNPDHGSPDSPIPTLDYYETETRLLKKFPYWSNDTNVFPLSQIPFQMFAYKVAEKEKSGGEEVSVSESQPLNTLSDVYESISERKNVPVPETAPKRSLSLKRSLDVKVNKRQATLKTRPKPSPLPSQGKRTDSESQLTPFSYGDRRISTGNLSDSKLI